MRPPTLYRPLETEFEDYEPLDHWQGDGNIETARSRHRHLKKTTKVPKPSKGSGQALTPLRYIRAQYRCVVHPDLPLKFYSSSSIPWNALLRVVMPPVDCPICISPASVPRMLECGHVMCLPCFYRFLKHSEDHFCPVCGDYFSGSTLPVSIMSVDPDFLPRPGHESVLRLMHKTPGHPALPLDEQLQLNDQPKTKPKPDMLLYSHVVCATLQYLRQEFKQEREILEKEQAEALDQYGDDECYPDALDAVRKCLQAKVEPLKAFKEDPLEEPAATTGSASAPGATNSAFFYQTAFESPMTFILSQLDISVLKAAFGEFSSFPTSLITTVESINHTSFEQEPALRKWCRYLSHVPDNAPLAIMECNWNNVLPAEVLKKYRKQLSARSKHTRDRNAKDEANRIKAQNEQDALFRLTARDEGPLPLNTPQFDMHSLPMLGGNNGQRVTKAVPKVWRKNEADSKEAAELIEAAKKSGKKGRKGYLKIEL